MRHQVPKSSLQGPKGPYAGFTSHSGEKRQACERVRPTPERLAQAAAAGDDAVTEVVTEVKDKAGNAERAVATRLADEPLELLFKRGAIDQEQYACGREYYRHWAASGLATSGVVDPARERVDGGQVHIESEVRQWHLERFQMMAGRLGTVHARVMRACVLMGVSMQDYGNLYSGHKDAKRAQTWAQSRLTAALEELALALLGDRTKRSHASMMAGARPVIPPSENSD